MELLRRLFGKYFLIVLRIYRERTSRSCAQTKNENSNNMISAKNKNKPKHSCYQDYVIKDGAFIGEFEEMYKDYDDPWEQTAKEEWASEKAIALNFIKKMNAKKVMEMGCGLGHFTKKIAALGVDVLGIDISRTAIDKAKSKHPQCKFVVGDILDYEIYRKFKPDMIIMSEITWYVLDKLARFIQFVKLEYPDAYLIHLLTTYPESRQTYGKDIFTNLVEIKEYFGAHYLEWGEIINPEAGGCKRTYFIGRYK